MSFINDFVQGVASQLINTGLRKVAGNLPGMSTTTGRGNNSDMLPLAPSGNVQNYTFPLDVMADPGMGNQGHYMMFYINEQQIAVDNLLVGALFTPTLCLCAARAVLNAFLPPLKPRPTMNGSSRLSKILLTFAGAEELPLPPNSSFACFC